MILAVLLAAGLATVDVEPFNVDAIRQVTVLGKEYVVEYDVDYDWAMVPGTTDGQPHYQARARVWHAGQRVGGIVGTQFVDGGCFDADPERVVGEVLCLCVNSNHHHPGSPPKLHQCPTGETKDSIYSYRLCREVSE